MATYTPHNKTSGDQRTNREKLYDLYKNSPLPLEEMLINTGLYTRSSALSKFFFLGEIYQKITNIPGNIHVFGTWWGQDVVLLHNLRAIYEPYNFTRKVVGFDTFTGYPGLSDKDELSDTLKKGAYNTSANYIDHLQALLDYHEQENTMSHINKFELVEGDILKTLPAYCEKNGHELISLIYIDVALYEPTKAILENCVPRLVKGSVIVFDELNAKEYPGETIALKESGLLNNCSVERSTFLPDRTILTYNG
ncbi:MAG TPA: TylF/MycF/NovP-related O-methyltransferase [Ferruginibacter sp.]|nr:TylF/MycF/NovP-related O-methyltransferase [Ferruginibacter sp.]